MTPLQSKLARTALGETHKTFAGNSNGKVSSISVVRFESGANLRQSTIDDIRDEYEKRGIQFIADSETSTSGGVGVRLKGE